jgi:hypothetical protein
VHHTQQLVGPHIFKSDFSVRKFPRTVTSPWHLSRWMSLGVKVHRYQSWYGEKCPYTNTVIKIKVLNQNQSSEEREYIAPISKGLIAQPPREIALQALEPKRSRPNSALRHGAGTTPVMPITIRPSSGLKLRPNRVPDSQRPADPANDLRSNRVLQISSALEKPPVPKELVPAPLPTPAHLSKPHGVESVDEINIITQRKIVPRFLFAFSPLLLTLSSVDKSYLKQRPLSPKKVEVAVPPLTIGSSQPPSPHPELIKRSLFVSGLRNTIKKADESQAAPAAVENTAPPDLQGLGLFERNPTEPDKTHRSRAQTALLPSKGSDFQVGRPKSSQRSTVRNSLLKSAARKVSAADPSQINTTGKAISTPRSSLISPKKSPTELSEEDSAGEDEKSTDETPTYPLFSIVEAR